MNTSFLISGATGKQGGAVISALLANPTFSSSRHTIYALTRNTASRSAQKLASRSEAIKLVSGDLGDSPAIFRSLPSVPTGVFSVTLPGKAEVAHGIGLIDAAAQAGVKHFVFTSVDRGGEASAQNETYVPHFKTKHIIEKHLEKTAAEKSFPYTILRPVFFLDNLEWGFIGKIISTAWRDKLAGKKLQVVDTRDIGWWGANALLNPTAEEFHNKAISLAGDELTFDEADKIFKEETGMQIPVTYGWLTAILVWLIYDVRMMFRFFQEQGFGADLKQLSSKHQGTDFRAWVRASHYAKKTA